MTGETLARVALAKHGFRFTKSLGQNFLLSDETISSIADAAEIAPGENVLEIGAGAGVLTREMALRGAKVLSLEIDEALFPVLREVLSDLRGAEGFPRVLNADALKCDLAALVTEAFGGGAYRVVANLPYYITSDALTRLLTLASKPQSVVLLLQKEAAERVCSEPGGKSWCALSAAAAYFAEREILFSVPRGAFTPPPHVDSALLRLNLYDEKPVRAADDAAMLRMIRCAFAMRRKTLVNNLIAAYGLSREAAEGMLRDLGLPVSVRGEALGLEKLALLTLRSEINPAP